LQIKLSDKIKIETGFAGYHYTKNYGLVRCYRYSWNTNVLEIGLNDGKLFWFYDFSQRNYSDFSISDDPDSYFKKYIFNKFQNEEYDKIVPDEFLLASTICLNRFMTFYQVGAYHNMIELCDRIQKKKEAEGIVNNSSFEIIEKAKALCKLNRFAEIFPLLEKQTGIYDSQLKIYALMKMDRTDEAVKLIKKLVKSRGDQLYIGRVEIPEVHELFIETSMISSLKRLLTKDEKQVIHDTVNNNSISYNDQSFVNLVLERSKQKTLYFNIDELEKIYQSFVKVIPEPSRFLTFDEARLFVHKLNLQNEKDWKLYCISGQKPDNIPLNPKKEYKFEWKSWDNWLGTKERSYLPFDECKKFVAQLNLENEKEWRLYCKSGKLPGNIPINPKNVFSRWNDYDDWLGILTREYLSFNEAKKSVSTLNFEYVNEWKEYCLSGQKPKNIPAKPDVVYEKEWIDWDDWFGVFEREYLSYQEQKKFVSTLNLESSSEWTEYAKSGQKPKNIPAKPFQYFGKKGYLFDFYDWIGLNERKYLSFIEARSIVRNLKLKNYAELRKWSESQRPSNIPANPSYVYKTEWRGYYDWTGILNQ